MSYQLTLTDGAVHSFSDPLTAAVLIQRILPFLVKKAVCVRHDGRLLDLDSTISSSGSFQVLTLQDAESLSVLRRSFAFVLGHALQSMFADTVLTRVQLTADGLSCDFSMPHALQESDLAMIDTEIKKILKSRMVLRLLPNEEGASELLKKAHYACRALLYQKALDQGVVPFFYSMSDDWVDFSELPCVHDFSMLSAFHLLSVAGAYWLDDAKNPMHQRIYVTLWPTPQDLSQYLEQRKEIERRDHRLLGKRLDFFHLQEEAPGMVFWHDRGYRLWLLIEQYIRQLLHRSGYQEVKTPQLVDRKLWEASGHWENYSQHMFCTESEKRTYAIKPMNCPCHVQIFNSSLRSYRDLPLRMAEFGTCHRNEPSGALHGLMRVRSFVQDDAHIFCTHQQIQSEVIAFNELVKQVYSDFGFREIDVKLSLRPEKSIGTAAMWNLAESSLREALSVSRLPFEELPGEGAFYGPKIEFHIKDAIGRSWQCGTLQLDFALPERLGATFVDEDNERRTPVMLHRAILGSIERFIGILIEHYAGVLPLWLSPVQVAVLCISEKSADYCQSVERFFTAHGLRCVSDLRSEKIGYKIREHVMLCVPYLLVVGEQEVASETVMVRRRNGDTLGQFSLEEGLSFLTDEIARKI